MGIAGTRATFLNQHILWTAPTFDQCRIGWGELQQAAGHMAEFRTGRMEATFPNGGKVIFRSLDDPDNARGHTADGILVDEAPMVKERAWYDVLRPIISDTGGWALLQGTPKGRNWFWREWVEAKNQEDSESWQVPTLGVRIEDGRLIRDPHPLENPYFPFSEAERMYQSQPQQTFEQEFLAMFVDDAGVVFRNVDVVSTLSFGEPPDYTWEENPHTYVFGVDWAKSYDWTVISVFDATTMEQVAYDRFNQIDYHVQLDRLETMYEKWKPSEIIAEANAMGEPLIEQLVRRNLPVTPFTTTQKSKSMMIESLAIAIERNEIKLLNDETQKMELKAYDMQRLPGGAFKYGAPSGMHDDMVIALALAYQGVNVGQYIY